MSKDPQIAPILGSPFDQAPPPGSALALAVALELAPFLDTEDGCTLSSQTRPGETADVCDSPILPLEMR